MEILKNVNQIPINISSTNDITLDWQNGINEYIKNELINDIINPIVNLETIRYINKPYSLNNLTICDVRFDFYFKNNNHYFLDYTKNGFTIEDIRKITPQSNNSFFKLEFYNETGVNKKLLFSKILTVPSSRRVLLKDIVDDIFIPIFIGNNIKNTENIYFHYFREHDYSKIYMKAKFYNAKEGSIIEFVNKKNVTNFNEVNDSFFEVILDNENFYYEIMNNDNRVGILNKAVKFYEI